MYKSKLYKYSPIIFQELLINAKAIVYRLLREGRSYKLRVEQLLLNAELSREELISLSKTELSKQLFNAKNNCEYYKNINGFELTDFPIIDKELVRGSPNKFLSSVKTSLWTFSSQTGGTTGKPLELYADLDAIIEDHAQSARQLHWAGFKPGDKRIWLRADLVVPMEQSMEPYWRRNIVDEMLMMSVYHINEQTVSDYVDRINKYKPDVIQAYPSALYLLAKLIESQGLVIDVSIKAVILSSESFEPNQAEIIERIFNAKVFSWYGLSERVATVGTCKEGQLHLIEDYGYYEFDDKNILIATGFHNKKMPLIRYNTGDQFVGVENEIKPCDCGSSFRKVKAIRGRVGEYLVSDKGSKVSIFNHIPKGVVGLVELQLKQVEPLKILALIVTGKDFKKSSEIKLINNIKDYLGSGMVVEIIYLDHIPRTKNGKFRQAIYEVRD
ncbi:phenylacetate--CoA ligase family protein [Shewanella sp. BF02_Schw]|uniref:phenylacetate--CoA ligase family protein n=1 Tax=Shewanella sp. BF02_Schw TaxID=394908 RepID=UPI00177DDEE2|nr:phenylacetate--CoA ligase family protein [Shewanella sp. BF02_Schw]MBO1894944.1 phenylacetate--CoA ligase family protein [Shewanella sp. BF02_Schw]